jgi:hypothetical protein
VLAVVMIASQCDSSTLCEYAGGLEVNGAAAAAAERATALRTLGNKVLAGGSLPQMLCVLCSIFGRHV